MAKSKGKADPKYKALLVNSADLADLLDANSVAKKKLLRQLKANGWIDPTTDMTTDQLVALVLQNVETEGPQYFDQFVEFLGGITGLDSLARTMQAAAEPPPQSCPGSTGASSQTTSGPLDLMEVKQEVLPLAARWKHFGLALGLRSDLLDRIEGDYRKVDDCLQETMKEWVSSVETLRGPPSWEMLVAAAANPAGGNNQALARDIANRHNVEVQAGKK